MKAKKSLGQNFLKSEKALLAIIRAGDVQKEDVVLEIGPGLGALTERLLEAGARVLAVEKDNTLFATLKQKYSKEISSKQLNLVCDDILNFNPQVFNLSGRKYKLIANIPYNITGIILKKFLGMDDQPEKIVFLLQKEVAQRIVAKDKKESILSLSVKAYGLPQYVETVKAGSFVPMPKVDSAIIAIENISKNFFGDFTEKEFFNIVRTGFQSKRKKLSSNLAIIFQKEKVEKAFEKLNLDKNIRAEDVALLNWQKLANLLLNK